MYFDKLPLVEHRGLSPHTPGLDMSEKKALHKSVTPPHHEFAVHPTKSHLLPSSLEH